MPLCGCSSGLLATALLTFLCIPFQYYIPDLYSSSQEDVIAEALLSKTTSTKESPSYLNWITFDHLPLFDLLLTTSLLMLAVVSYLCDWIQRKLMERRIIKLNQYLTESVERLREWDARQEQLEATLRMVQNATSEYNLLLYLLLRQHRQIPSHKSPPTPCFYEKSFEDLNFIRKTTIDV